METCHGKSCLVLGGTLLDGPLDGIVDGALVDMGFAFTENVLYLTFVTVAATESQQRQRRRNVARKPLASLRTTSRPS
jgi:RsiW-degrading membrane proteinase PrsW (M82 family)